VVHLSAYICGHLLDLEGVAMVLAKSPLFKMIKKGFKIVDIRYRKRGQIEIGVHRIPFNPRTDAQTKQRTWYGQRVEEWRGLTQEERDSYDEKAKPFFISGFNYFLQTWVMPPVGLVHITTKQVTDAATVDFVDLDGDKDFMYVFYIAGKVIANGADRYLHLIPNDLTGLLITWKAHAREQTGTWSGSGDKPGFSVGRNAWSTDNYVFFIAWLLAKTGSHRFSRSFWEYERVDEVNGGSGYFGAVWKDTTTNITKLTLNMDGGLFTGTIKLYKLVE